jgi:hypothetical protein
MRKFLLMAAILAVALSGLSVSSAAAQSAIDAQWAEQFVGSWDVRLETPDGEVPMVLTVTQEGGTVGVQLGTGQGTQPVNSVRRTGESLVASYGMNYQGMPINAVITMTRNGEALATKWSFADGAYETTAAGARR